MFLECDQKEVVEGFSTTPYSGNELGAFHQHRRPSGIQEGLKKRGMSRRSYFCQSPAFFPFFKPRSRKECFYSHETYPTCAKRKQASGFQILQEALLAQIIQYRCHYLSSAGKYSRMSMLRAVFFPLMTSKITHFV